MGERRERSPAKRERSPAIKKDRSPIKRGERERSPLKKGDLKSPIKRGERSPGKRDRSADDLKKEGRERSVGQVARDVGSKVEKAEKPEVPKFVVDREKTCPLLLRVFCSQQRHNNMSEYMKGQTPQNELQIYTWMDATLKELTGLIKEVNPESRRRGTYFDFAIVYPDLRQGPRCNTRDIGTTVAGQKGPDDNMTLKEAKFCIGDFLDVSINSPNGRMDRFGDRRGGFGDRGGFGGGRFDDRGRNGGGFCGPRGDRDGGFGAGRDREGGFGAGRDREGGFGAAREREGGFGNRDRSDRS